MDNNTLQENLINQFIMKVKEQYPNLNIQYEYKDNEYNIWHTDKYLQLTNKEFLEYAGQLIQEIFFNNNFYNFSFGYDYSKDVNQIQYKNELEKNFIEELLKMDDIKYILIYEQHTIKKYDIYIQNYSTENIMEYSEKYIEYLEKIKGEFTTNFLVFSINEFNLENFNGTNIKYDLLIGMVE